MELIYGTLRVWSEEFWSTKVFQGFIYNIQLITIPVHNIRLKMHAWEN